MPWSFDGNTFVWHKPVLCLTSVSVVTIVFAIAGERNDPALPAHFFFVLFCFVMCSKTVKQQHASCIGQLHWRGKLLLTYLPPPPPHRCYKASVWLFFFTAAVIGASVPFNEAGVCDDACSGTSCHVLLCFCFGVPPSSSSLCSC